MDLVDLGACHNTEVIIHSPLLVTLINRVLATLVDKNSSVLDGGNRVISLAIAWLLLP
jgi:hypothetical protein